MPSTEFSVLLKHDYERLMMGMYGIEAEREKDRSPVRGLPRFLAQAGL